MMGLLPLATFLVVAILCQTVGIGTALVIDELGWRWAGLGVFGLLYLGMFAVAWRITVLIVERYFVPRGYVESGDTRARAAKPRSADLAHSVR